MRYLSQALRVQAAVLADRAVEELARWAGHGDWRPADAAERELAIQAWEDWWQTCKGAPK